MCSKLAPWRCRHTWIRQAKLSMTLMHSSLGITVIVAVIADFMSGIAWGLLIYTLSLRYPHRYKSGGSSLVNVATISSHICSRSVSRGNAAVAMAMISLKCQGWHHPVGNTGGPCQPSAVKNLQSTWRYHSVLIVTDCLLSSLNQNGPMMPCLEMAT